MFFKSKEVSISKSDIIKEGYLEKESRYRKVWRKRWCVLTNKMLYTFEQQGSYINPTEEIETAKMKTVKTDETRGPKQENSNFIRIELQEDVFVLKAASFEEKESWIGAIGKAMIKGSFQGPGDN
jgi:hypothetical protein